VKLLVVTSEPISARELRSAVGDGGANNQTEVMVVAPALQQSAFRFWVSDADEAIERAEDVRRATVENLGEEGVAASGDTGESDPLDAIRDALATFPADRIVVFTHPASERRYREDVDPSEVEERFGLPVDQATVGQ
jgi:hypothetical protein